MSKSTVTKRSLIRWTAYSLLLGGLLSAGLANAYAPDDDLMKTKGYSPEMIRMTDVQRSRQEWREPPAPVRSPIQNAFHNVVNNNWTGSFDEFGSNIIRNF